MDDFVNGSIERLSLAGGKFVDVKRRLSAGEREDMYARMWPDNGNRRYTRSARILAYLVGWSLTKDNAPVPYTLSMPETDRLSYIDNLDPDRFDEIHEAIVAHETAARQAREAQKKILAGSNGGAVTSGSPSVPAGASSGSAPSIPTTTPPS